MRALTGGHAGRAEEALTSLREGRGTLDDLAEARRESEHMARRTLRGRVEAGSDLDRLDARLDRLDVLHGTSLHLARTVCGLLRDGAEPPEGLRRAVEAVAADASALAEDIEAPVDGRRPETSADGARESSLAAQDPRLASLAEAVRTAASDLGSWPRRGSGSPRRRRWCGRGPAIPRTGDGARRSARASPRSRTGKPPSGACTPSPRT